MLRGRTFFVAVLALVGCKQDDEPAAGCTLTLTDANDYSYTADLTLASVAVASLTDDVIDWSALTVDYRGRPLDPTDVDQVTIAKFAFDPATLTTKFETDTLLQGDIGDYRICATSGQTSVHLSDCAIIGQAFDPAVDFGQTSAYTWLATIWKANDRGQLEILSSQFMVPTDGEPNTTVAFDDTSASLAFTVDLHSAPAVPTLASCDDWSADWSAVKNDVNGAAFDPKQGDTLRIAHLPVDAVADVEAVFLQLDLAADQTYFLTSYAVTSVPSLDEATTTDGAAFPGFTTDGVWILAIECTALTCFSPAPKVLTVLDVQ